MHHIRKLIIFSIIVLLLSGLSLSSAGVAEVQAQAATVVYNLYATDGYIEMADGLPVYSYGFIGGRQGVDFTYTTSYCTGDGISRACATPANVTVPGGAVAPMGGPWTGQDAQFAGNAQFPAPVVYATVGDIVEIRLKNLGVTAQPNAPNDPHSIHLHGLDVDAANDGVPETSLGAVPANLCADGTTAADGNCASGPAPSAGNVIVYMFAPDFAGTYMYHCHQEADIHVNMGMFGALVVYNPLDPAAVTGPGMGMGGDLYGFTYDKDFVLLLGEFDIRGHADEEGTYGGLVPANTWDPNPFNWALYEPQYWFINGLSFPNTIHADFPSGYTFADWLLAHPGYDPLVTGSVSVVDPMNKWGTPGEKALIRVINMGFETQPMHMHGYHGKVIGSDQRGWDWANSPGNASAKNPKGPTAFGMGLEKNTLTIGSGETYDWLIDFGQQSFNSVYSAGTQSCIDAAGNPVQPTDPACVAPAYWEGDQYIQGPVVAGLFNNLVPGATSQFFPFHNHDDYKATNDGVYPGGMFTMIVPTP